MILAPHHEEQAAEREVHVPTGLTAIFAHDHRFLPLGDQVFADGQFGSQLWDRYLQVFRHLTVVGRHRSGMQDPEAAGLAVSSRPGVGFELLPDLSTLRHLLFRRGARGRMMQVVAEADGVIARLPSEMGLLALECARCLDKPAAVEVVGCTWDALWNHGSTKAKHYAPLGWRRMRRAVKHAPFALYVTESFLQRRYPCEGTVVHASDVILGPADPATLAARLKRVVRDDVEPVRLGLIGTLHTRYKGIETVLDALARIRGSVPPHVFEVLGPGDRGPWDALARRYGVSDIVHFRGVLPPGRPVLEWLDGIDLYLQPSLQEGLPRALIEAMSRACPAIGSTRGGIPDLLEREDLVPPSSPGSLARLLRRRLGDRRWMAARAERNWRIAGRYEPGTLENRRLAFYRSFAASCSATCSQVHEANPAALAGDADPS